MLVSLLTHAFLFWISVASFRLNGCSKSLFTGGKNFLQKSFVRTKETDNLSSDIPGLPSLGSIFPEKKDMKLGVLLLNLGGPEKLEVGPLDCAVLFSALILLIFV